MLIGNLRKVPDFGEEHSRDKTSDRSRKGKPDSFSCYNFSEARGWAMKRAESGCRRLYAATACNHNRND